jgi:hypothetical protein
MGNFLMKPDPNEDFYVEWSTVTGDPIAYGDRKEFQEYDPERYKDARFDRADETGTSAYLRDMAYGKELWIGQSWEIKRDMVKPYVIETFAIKDFDFCKDEFAPIVEKYATRLVFDD